MMKTSEKSIKEVVLSGFTPKAVIISAVLHYIINLYYVHQGAVFWQHHFNRSSYGPANLSALWGHQTSPFFTAMGWMTVMVIVIALINKFKPIFSAQEVAVMCMIVPLGSIPWGLYISVTMETLMIPFGILVKSPAEQVQLYQLLPDIWGPKSPIPWREFNANTNIWTIPWGTVMGISTWLMGFIISEVLVGVFLALLFRYLLVHVEYLNPPMSEIWTFLVNSSQRVGEKAVALFHNKFFLIGFAISLIHTGVAWLQGWLTPFILRDFRSYFESRGFIRIPGWGDIYIWPVADITPQALLPWVPLYLTFNTFEIGWVNLLSMETIVGCLIAWVAVWVIWPLTNVALGRLPAFTTGITEQSAASYVHWGPQGEGMVPIEVGLLLGLAILPMIRNRGVMGPILKALFRRPDPKLDSESPIPYRYVWIGLIASVAFFLAILAAIKVTLLAAIIWISIMLLLFVGAIRLVIETGGYYSHWTYPMYGRWPAMIGTFILIAGGWGAALGVTQEAMANIYMISWTMFEGCALFWIGMIGWYLLHGFIVARDTKTEPKSILKAVLLAGIMAAIIAPINYYLWIGILPMTGGFEGWASVRGDWWQRIIRYIQTSTYPTPPAQALQNPQNVAICIAIGFIVILAVTIMRDRLAWFRVSAAGIALGMIFGFNFFTVFIVSYIIKSIVLRIGGVAMYNAKLKPLSIGLVLGASVIIAVQGLLWFGVGLWKYYV
jgi:hypothetical protein